MIFGLTEIFTCYSENVLFKKPIVRNGQSKKAGILLQELNARCVSPSGFIFTLKQVDSSFSMQTTVKLRPMKVPCYISLLRQCLR
jgi:hypothetical protein